jgi:glycosyltransferase involved in cell wall biosynthesis
MAEVVEDGVNGILVDVGDTVAMSDHLAAIAASPETRSRLGLAAAATADERLDISHQVGRFIEAYAGLMTEH